MTKTRKPLLTDKQKAANDEYINNPKISKTEAIVRTYNVASRKNASAMVPKTFNTPAARRYREDQVERAANNIVEIANDKKVRPDVRLKANQDILDRNDGKATQKTENKSQTVKIIADFTGGTAGERPQPVAVLEQEPVLSLETPEAELSPSFADD